MKYIDLGLPSGTWWADEDLSENTHTYDQACVFSVPTLEQFEELKTKCKWKLVNNKYFNGYKVIGPNSAFILLPFRQGASRYWLKNEKNANQGWYFYISPVSKISSCWNKSALQYIRTVFKAK